MTHDDYVKIAEIAKSEGKSISKYCQEHDIDAGRVYWHISYEKKRSEKLCITKVTPVRTSVPRGQFTAEIGCAKCHFDYSNRDELVSILEAFVNV